MSEELPERFLTVWEVEGEIYTLFEYEEPRINAAVQEYVDSGKTRDRILCLTMTDGREYYTLVSRISSWAVSTPETRKRSMLYGMLQRQEDEEFRSELGVWEDS